MSFSCEYAFISHDDETQEIKTASDSQSQISADLILPHDAHPFAFHFPTNEGKREGKRICEKEREREREREKERERE